MLNKVMLHGRLTRDPELRYTAGQATAVCSFTLAVDRNFKNAAGEKEADFIKIVAWRKLAEICGEHLAKGRQVVVCGRLQVRSYEDKEGNRRTIAEVVIDEMDFAGSKGGDSRQGRSGNSGDDFADMIDGVEVSDDDVPF